MKAVSKILAGGIGLAALAGAAPAAAQYYPGYGQPNVLGQVLNQVLGGSQYGHGGYGMNSQAAVQRCAAAVEQRINQRYRTNNAYGGYGGYGGYGNNAYAGGTARVLGVTSVERRSSGLRVRGVATSNAYAGGYGGQYGSYGGQYGGYGGQYGGGYGGYGGYNGGYGGGYAAPQQQADLSFKCNIDYRGYVTDIDLNRNNYAYGNRRY